MSKICGFGFLLRQKNTESFGAPAPAPPFIVIKQTLNDLVRSEVILEPVVETFKLYEKKKIYYPVWYKRWFHQIKDLAKEYRSKFIMILKYGRIVERDAKLQAIIKLSKNVDIVAKKDSYLYALSLVHNNPKQAAMILDAISQNLVNWVKNQDQNPAIQKYTQIKQELSKKEAAIKILRNEWKGLLEKNKIVSLSKETDEGVESLYEMERESVRLRALIEKKKKKVLEYNHAMQGKTHDYIDPEDLENIESMKIVDEIELSGLIAEMESLESSIVNLKSRLNKLPILKKREDNIAMKIEAGTREYLHLSDLYLEAYTQVATVQVEAKVLHPSLVGSSPVQPIKIYHVGLTAVLSFFFSTGIVYVLSFFNIRIFFTSKGWKARKTTSEISVKP